MKINVRRLRRLENSTLAKVTIDGKDYGYILEDLDRGLDSSMSLAAIMRIKIHGRTAIPTGTYRVISTLSPRFKRVLPRLVDVPGFSGILIHTGNTHLNTEGCLIPGKDFVQVGYDYQIRGGTSKPAFDELFAKITNTIKSGEQVTITITRDYDLSL